MRTDNTVLEDISIRLQRRVRFAGDKEPPFWQADVWPNGQDYHAVGATPQEAILELAMFWRSRTETAQQQPKPTDMTVNEKRT